MEKQHMDSKLYTTAPDPQGRTPEELSTYALLDRLQIPYARVDHPAAATIADCEKAEKLLEAKICKNLFLRDRTGSRYYLLLMPGEKQFKTKELSKQINTSRLSFGDEEMLWELLRLRPGSISVMGLQFDSEHRVTLLIDEDLKKEPRFGCHPCVNTASLKVEFSDILEKFLPFTGHAPTWVALMGGE